ncbi:MAG: NAD(+) synthase [Clostridia bacterium]|nr:NAD(+) synthase [Clostridia bacterium]
MKFGFVKTAAITPQIRVADVEFNVKSVIKEIEKADVNGVELAVFPELCLTGYTCGDLFYSDVLLNAASRGLKEIVKATAGRLPLVFVGLPLKKDGRLYNIAAAAANGRLLGIVPKTFMPNYNEFYEKRYFNSYAGKTEEISFSVGGEKISAPFGKNILFCEENNANFKVAAEICEDLWTADPPSVAHAIAGATVIVNLSCSDETIGKAEYRRDLVKTQSARLTAAYVYADAGDGESTTDAVFAGHDLIAENGSLLSETEPFDNGAALCEIDVGFLAFERTKTFNYDFGAKENGDYVKVGFSACSDELPERIFSKTPFVPAETETLFCRAELILKMQAEGLKKRLVHTRVQTVVVGLSGGLDSTLAILVAVKAAILAGKSAKDVIAVTMPCFGTTSRTFDNTVKLSKALGVSLKKVDITKSVLRHLKDIKHGGETDVTYENAQARERTQVLMDVANMTGGMVVGTGDLSELALGWATYNGDHMSMYGVNASVPKTLVRHLVKYCADRSRGKLKAVLYDILDTPISPELLPPKDGEISQKTEDIVGPYELHDFFLYHFIRRGSSPAKIYVLAKTAFDGDFDGETIKKWLKIFVRRFFAQQFKRSCLPDGVKIGSVALSPRGDWRMPSDAVCALWLAEAEEL